MSELNRPGYESTTESDKPVEIQRSNNETKVDSYSEAPKLDVDTIRQEVQLLEQPEQPLELPLDDSPEGDQPVYIDRAMKKLTLKHELTQIRTKLPAGQRLLSKVIHQPTARRVNEVAARTVTRPVGLLGGGILAFCGSLVYLLFTKYVGLKYNFFVLVLLFIVGYLLTTLIELLTKLVRPQKQD